MTLYRNDTTGFLGDFLTGDPGEGWTLIPDMPGAPLMDVVNWWRDVDKGDLTSDWHPSLQSGQEIPRPRGLAGSGVNIFPPRYSSWESTLLPPIVTDGCTVELISPGYAGRYALRITALQDNAECWLTPSRDEYPIRLTPGLRWLFSGYFSAPVENFFFEVIAVRADAKGSNQASINAESWVGLLKSTWVRRKGWADFTNDPAVQMQMGFKLYHTGDVLDLDAFMLEEFIGDTVQPSAYYCPPVLTDGEQIVENSLTWSASSSVAEWQTLSPSTLPQSVWEVSVPDARIRGSISERLVLDIQRPTTTDPATLVGTLKRAGKTVKETRLSAVAGQENLQLVLEYVDTSGDLGQIDFDFMLNCDSEVIEWRGSGLVIENKR